MSVADSLMVSLDQLAGFYRSNYVDAHGKSRYMAVTQCEATDCRRVMPCFDEPAMKAVFAVSLVAPPHCMALSNMTVKQSVSVTASEAKRLSAELEDEIPGWFVVWL